VDVTNKSSNGFRELLAGAGHQFVTVSGNGVFTDSVAEDNLRTAMQAQRNRNSSNNADQDPAFTDFKVLVPLMGATGNDTTLYTMTFKGMIASLEYAGEYNGEVTYSITVESASAVTVGTS
jgi:predicted secreted protein